MMADITLNKIICIKKEGSIVNSAHFVALANKRLLFCPPIIFVGDQGRTPTQ